MQLNTLQIGCICSECHDDLTLTDTSEIQIQDNQVYCESCFNDLYFCCNCCTDIYSKDCAIWSEYDESYICDSCYCDDYITCECCDCVTHNRDSHCDDSHNLCSHCFDRYYSTCNNCDCIINRDYTYITECDSDTLCESCYNEHYCNCSQCNEDLEVDLASHSAKLKYNGQSEILDYKTAINWEFYQIDSDLNHNPYIGLELELQHKDNRASLSPICNLIGKELHSLAVAMHDGSLTNGLEIITTPHKFQALKKNLKLRQLCAELIALDARSHDTKKCGFHVHISKINWFKESCKPLSKEYGYSTNKAQLYQYVFTKLRRYITRISGRDDEQIESYCQFRNSDSSRYVAVNLTNSKTVEVRIWNGTLNYKTLKMRLKFTLAMLEYLQQVSAIHITRNTVATIWTSFKYWLSQNNQYTDLLNWLNNKIGE